jgi:hypothetical protein
MDQTTAIILAALVTGIFTLGASIFVTIPENNQASNERNYASRKRNNITYFQLS